MDDIERLVGLLIDRSETLSTAESCTGGLLAAAITDIPGVSECFKGGAVTYANEIKQSVLDVGADTLASHGAVSEECAREMAIGARRRFDTDWSIVTTGIAGPGGATPDKPVGLVYIGIAGRDTVTVFRNLFSGNRAEVRRQTVARAAALAIDIIQTTPRKALSNSAK